MTAKKASAAKRVSNIALDGFEKAMKALGRREYEKARDVFDTLIADHPEERDIVERARAYRVLCERALDKRPAFRPKGFEELLNHGVFLHNRGEYDDALKALRQAAEIHPRNEHVLYCLAATTARAGDPAGALKALRSAIAASPASRAQARSDADFDSLRDDEEFASLIHS